MGDELCFKGHTAVDFHRRMFLISIVRNPHTCNARRSCCSRDTVGDSAVVGTGMALPPSSCQSIRKLVALSHGRMSMRTNTGRCDDMVTFGRRPSHARKHPMQRDWSCAPQIDTSTMSRQTCCPTALLLPRIRKVRSNENLNHDHCPIHKQVDLI